MENIHLAVSIGNEFFSQGGVGKAIFGAPTLSGISLIVSMFLRGAFSLAGLILLFYFILGGIGIMSGAGKSDPKAIEQAKATLTSALIGFAVVFTSYWIVKLIGNLFGLPNII
jgi:hypothetical protein